MGTRQARKTPTAIGSLTGVGGRVDSGSRTMRCTVEWLMAMPARRRCQAMVRVPNSEFRLRAQPPKLMPGPANNLIHRVPKDHTGEQVRIAVAFRASWLVIGGRWGECCVRLRSRRAGLVEAGQGEFARRKKRVFDDPRLDGLDGRASCRSATACAQRVCRLNAWVGLGIMNDFVRKRRNRKKTRRLFLTAGKGGQ
jgi:hypothetical protein